MDERVTQFRVGALIVATILIVGLMVVLFGGKRNFLRHQYTIFVRFPQAPGVTADTPVLKSGVLIGRVAKVTLLDDDQAAVVVTAKIDSDRQLRRSEVCRISTGNILGDAVLEFVPSGNVRPRNAEPYFDGDYLDGIVAKDPLAVMETATSALQIFTNLESDMRLALQSVQVAGEQVGSVANGLSAVVGNNADQFQRILTKSEQAMDRLDFAMTAIDRFLRDDTIKQQFEEAIGQVPDLMTDASDVMATLKESMASFKNLGGRIDQMSAGVDKMLTRTNERIDEVSGGIEEVVQSAQRNLKNLEGLTEPLGQHGEELVGSLQTNMDRIDDVMANLATFSDALNNQEGSIGRLVYSTELYDRVNDAVANIETMTRRVGPAVDRLQPILNDVRIFTDKISRDPGQLGLRGVIDRRQAGTKW